LFDIAVIGFARVAEARGCPTHSEMVASSAKWLQPLAIAAQRATRQARKLQTRGRNYQDRQRKDLQ
jgi:hypothetical protein